MKKRVAAIAMVMLISFLILPGCQASKGLETDEIKIPQYKDLEVAQVEKPEEVTDEQVEADIQTILKSKAEVSKVTDRAVQDGDTANIDFVGKIDGKEFEGGSAEGYPLEIGKGQFIPGFEDSVIGQKIGETYDRNGQFPESYGNADYAGKDVVFTITVNSISESVSPELTDEFVQSVSEKSKTVDEYKAEIKEKLQVEAEDKYKSKLGTAAMEKIVENTEVKKYSDDEIKKYVDSATEYYKTMAEYQNMEFADYLEQSGVTEEQFETMMEDNAKNQVKQTMIIKAIADKEKIEVTDEIYEEQAERIASSLDYESVDVLKEVSEEDELKDAVLYNLVYDWLAEHCIQIAS